MIVLLSLAVSFCKTAPNTKKENYEQLYVDCATDYNKLVRQDNECAKELDKCLSATEVNQDVLKDINKKMESEKNKSFLNGLVIGSVSVSIIAIILVYVPNR